METSTLIHDLLTTYSEDPNMPDQLEEYVKQSLKNYLRKMKVYPLKRLRNCGLN
jgi:hypothetical protein